VPTSFSSLPRAPYEAPPSAQKGSLNRRTQEIVSAARKEGITPLDYLLRVLRDPKETAERRFAAASTAAPYLHPRLASVEARIETALVVMSPEERRQRARQAILDAFAERPLKLIEGEVIDAAETLATEREEMGRTMGIAEVLEANHLEDRENRR
jgi:hypothetical protein